MSAVVVESLNSCPAGCSHAMFPQADSPAAETASNMGGSVKAVDRLLLAGCSVKTVDRLLLGFGIGVLASTVVSRVAASLGRWWAGTSRRVCEPSFEHSKRFTSIVERPRLIPHDVHIADLVGRPASPTIRDLP
jgi:hypothetical protein